MEMQHVGMDSNELRAQPRRSLYLDELTSAVQPYMSASCPQERTNAALAFLILDGSIEFDD
jgi:hypothetical protein